MSLFDNLKLTYSRYVTALFLKAPYEKDINSRIDKVIDNNMENKIRGDKDLKKIIQYAINCRKLDRQLLISVPVLSSMVFFKAFMKSFI